MDRMNKLAYAIAGFAVALLLFPLFTDLEAGSGWYAAGLYGTALMGAVLGVGIYVFGRNLTAPPERQRVKKTYYDIAKQ